MGLSRRGLTKGCFALDMITSSKNIAFDAKSAALLIIIYSLWFSLLILILVQPVFAQKHELSGQTVEIVAPDGFKLSAQLSPSSVTAPGVLFLHDCAHTSKDYQPLISALSKQGFAVLALDLRGYGASQSALYSAQKIRQQADDIISYQGQLAALMLHWQKDVFQAYQYLQSTMKNKQGISIVTSGCSSNQAIYLAEKTALKRLVMLAPELSYSDKEQFKRLTDLPIYLLSAKYQTETLLNVEELFAWNGDKHSVLQIVKGDGSGYDLLSYHAYVNEHIATWLHQGVEK